MQNQGRPSEKTNLTSKYPDKVAALEKRANELASVMAKPMLLQAEFTAIRQRLAMLPPAFPGEEFEFDEEQ